MPALISIATASGSVVFFRQAAYSMKFNMWVLGTWSDLRGALQLSDPNDYPPMDRGTSVGFRLARTLPGAGRSGTP